MNTRFEMGDLVYAWKLRKGKDPELVKGYINVIEEFNQRGDKENLIFYGITKEKFLPLFIKESLNIERIGRFEHVFKSFNEAKKFLSNS